MRTNRRVGAIIYKNDKLLLIHRKKDGAEFWVLPGGGVEEGETIEEALNREVLEETSLKLVKCELIKEVKDEKTDVIHLLYNVKLEKGAPKLGGPEQKENSENNWHNLEWIDKEKFSELQNVYPACLHEYVF